MLQQEQKIWEFFRGKKLSDCGIAGLMGNLYAESELICNRVETLCLQRLRAAGKDYTDDTYTQAVDTGIISAEEFLHPIPGKQYGYGLAQWTSPGRKAGLYTMAKNRGVSIANLEVQLDFLWKELTESYSNVLSVLKTAKTVREASDIVLKKFECPSDTGEKVQILRAGYGQKYYDKYADAESAGKGGNMGVTKISNCGHDEHGQYRGGAAGDQTGKEWEIRDWYNRPWNCVLRHPDPKVRKLIAELAVEAANNNRIGYDQGYGDRDTFWQQLKRSGYHPKNIKVNCETDCSAGTIAITKSVGYLLGMNSLKNLAASYTGDMRQGYKIAGFYVLTSSKYLASSDYLLAGDIILNDGHHVAVNVTNGSKAGADSTPSSSGSGSGSGSASGGSGTTLNRKEKFKGTVTTELYVRTWAGKENPQCSFSPLKEGTKVSVCDTVKADDGTPWYYISYKGKYGFVNSKYIKR